MALYVKILKSRFWLVYTFEEISRIFGILYVMFLFILISSIGMDSFVRILRDLVDLRFQIYWLILDHRYFD